MNRKTVVVLGGGIGGIVTANALRKKLNSIHRVLLVDKQSEFVFAPSLLWVMRGWRRPEQVSRKLRRLVNPGVEVNVCEAQRLDLDGGQIETNAGNIDYDYLVVSLGAELVPAGIPGFGEAALSPYDLSGATQLKESLLDFEGGRMLVLVTSTPYKCPAAPYETALLVDDFLRSKRIRERCELEVYTPEILPMGVAGPEMGQAVVSMLETKSISFNPKISLNRIDPERKELNFTDSESVPFDFLIAVPPHRPPAVVQGSELANEAGWIPVDRKTMKTRYENVYAIGDVAAVTLANGKPLSKAGVFAEGQGHIVAGRIADEIEGVEARAEFDGLGFCWIETGEGQAGFAGGEFYAEPDPVVPLPRSGRTWHWGKILFEKYWLSKGISRFMAKSLLRIGGKLMRVPASF